jgi:N-acetylglucosaminyl-diphospho-decaprenol L-rhamnosyltransferase
MPQETVRSEKVRVAVISIVVVHWNTPDLLRNCLMSIKETHPASLPNTIIVDCKSSEPDISGLVSQFEGVKLIHLASNDGYAAGCNAGAVKANTESILFLNADTEIHPGAIDALGRCFDLNPRVGLVAPLLLNPDNSLQSSGYAFPGAANIICDLLPVPDRIRASTFNGRADAGNWFHPYAVDYALGAALAVRTSAFMDIGGWDENYGMYSEEIDLARRLEFSGWMRLIEPRARITHVGGASTSQRAAAMEAALWRSRGLYHRRWSGRGRRMVLHALVDVATRVRNDDEYGKAVRKAFASGLSS